MFLEEFYLGVIQIVGNKNYYNKLVKIHKISKTLNELENIFSVPQTTGIIEHYFMFFDRNVKYSIAIFL